MSARLLVAHFGALQQKDTQARRLRLGHRSDALGRLAEPAGVLYNRQQA
jgi:hypothetical protein